MVHWRWLSFDGHWAGRPGPDEDPEQYHTLGRVPRTGDTFVQHGYRFEVVDMDGNRVDRVLATKAEPAGLPTDR